jgi:hypothetical protein
MVTVHYAYKMININATWGILTIRADITDAVYCVKEMDKAAMVGESGGPSKAMLGGMDSNPNSTRSTKDKKTSSQGTPCEEAD